MKIRELLSEDGNPNQVNGSAVVAKKEPQNKRIGRSDSMPGAGYDPNYTPGKAALDKEYEIVDAHTKTIIPHIQQKLDDPRN